ncbi:MAG: DNA adenine methylase [Candidatus Hydrogenedentota bacterium]
MPVPFLKWAGGKTKLLEELRQRLAMVKAYGAYHEPFVGGGAVFFDLYQRGVLAKRAAYLSDSNPRLIEAYEGVRDHVEEVIHLLQMHVLQHCKDHYYRTRAEMPDTLAERAARIIYLNRTCFNGLYRENSKGIFNVPMGDYKNPRICDAENLRVVAKALQGNEVACRPFEAVAEKAERGDLVYFDPPYQPVSKTASFTAYSRDAFGEAEQRRLAALVGKLTEKGVRVLLSNSWTPLVLELYADYTIEQVFAPRRVNCRADRRGNVCEALVRNYSKTGRVAGTKRAFGA